MIKSELMHKIANANPHLYHRDVERIVKVVFDEIVEALSRGDRVELRGFGAFTVKHRAARQGRNPRTGKSVSVEEKFVPFFKTGKELRERLNRTKKTTNARGSLHVLRRIVWLADRVPGGAAARHPGRRQSARGAARARPVPSRDAGACRWCSRSTSTCLRRCCWASCSAALRCG